MRPYTKALAALLLCSTPLGAQSVPMIPTLTLSGGVMQYDLSGTGDEMMYAARVEAPYSRLLILEGGIAGARLKQQFGDTTTFIVVDGQAQLQWPLRVVRPYIGAGAGMSIDARDDEDGGTDTDIALSAAVGARAPLRDRLGMRAELRVRGIGTNFSGSTAEWTLGLSWRL
jgi:hypothetical protein